MPSFDPGGVVVRLTSVDGHIAGAEVSCIRPDVARLLRGQPADQAVTLVPLIYSLCGKAQGVAARVALVAARGNGVDVQVDVEVLAEAAREHAWKLFVDWPRQFGLAPDEVFFVRMARASSPERAEMAAALQSHCLPAALRAELGTETGADNIDGLLRERIDARLTQLLDWLLDRAQILGTVRADAVAVGIGAARVETARGTLVHRLRLAGDKVADYSVIAPTDVHFSPGGEVARWLRQLRGLPKAEAERMAARLIMAFDPCVPWQCEYP